VCRSTLVLLNSYAVRFRLAVSSVDVVVSVVIVSIIIIIIIIIIGSKVTYLDFVLFVL
jgi:hypothetical protein